MPHLCGGLEQACEAGSVCGAARVRGGVEQVAHQRRRVRQLCVLRHEVRRARQMVMRREVVRHCGLALRREELVEESDFANNSVNHLSSKGAAIHGALPTP